MQTVARQRSQSALAYSKLKQQIQSNGILPGELLSETGLAREFGMSRTPVREAVQKLGQEGLLVVLPSRGIMVASLTVTDIEEIYAIREVLEGLAARIAAARVSAAGVTRLKELLSRTQSAVEAGDSRQYQAADHEFHAAIAAMAGNRRLARLLENMRAADVLQQFNSSALARQAWLERSLEQHRTIIDAIESGDSDGAQARMSGHAKSAVRAALLGAFGAEEIQQEEMVT